MTNNVDENSLKKTIAIFVSHRIDLKCETPPNPIFIPMRCGAEYDKKRINNYVGDNTGDNISTKRNSYCELTVQYWAWKNYVADYYGLFHYRRYFSFSDSRFPVTRFCVNEKNSISETEEKYKLNNYDLMYNSIVSFDAIVPKPTNVWDLTFKNEAGEVYHPQKVLDFWMAKTDQVIPQCIELIIKIVSEKYPKYYLYLKKYLNNSNIFVGNLYIMKRELFNELCEFEFGVLEEFEKRFELSKYNGEFERQPAFMGEILTGTFLYYLEKSGYLIKKQQIVLFNMYGATSLPKTNKVNESKTNEIKSCKNTLVIDIPPKKIASSCPPQRGIKNNIKILLRKIFPAYKVSLRNEVILKTIQSNIVSMNTNIAEMKINMSKERANIAAMSMVSPSFTTSILFKTACFANEVYITHKNSFSEFKNSNIGKDIVVVATGSTMYYYKQIRNAQHVGVNMAYRNPNIQLDYFFMTDFECYSEESMNDLKEYNFIKFFGQYSPGVYQDRFQASEQMIFENQGRRFYQAAPDQIIVPNIEFYPLMGFYTIALQAIQFALYTNPRKLYLVGCDCSNNGYFDGTKQIMKVPPVWISGYIKLKRFAEHFYPKTQIISINPVGLKGLFQDVYTENYLLDHPEIDRETIELLNLK